jgi:hypothetical protein
MAPFIGRSGELAELRELRETPQSKLAGRYSSTTSPRRLTSPIRSR